MEWINVEDKLPELDKGVLCYVEVMDIDNDKYHTISVGHRFINYTGEAVFMASDSGFIKESKITHWMPLPTPPTN